MGIAWRLIWGEKLRSGGASRGTANGICVVGAFMNLRAGKAKRAHTDGRIDTLAQASLVADPFVSQYLGRTTARAFCSTCAGGTRSDLAIERPHFAEADHDLQSQHLSDAWIDRASRFAAFFFPHGGQYVIAFRETGLALGLGTESIPMKMTVRGVGGAAPVTTLGALPAERTESAGIPSCR